jgi:hypothetical protein
VDKDIALVKFDKPLEINTYVSPICLPTREPNVDDFCAVVGWGQTRGEYISLLIVMTDIYSFTHIEIVIKYSPFLVTSVFDVSYVIKLISHSTLHVFLMNYKH